MCNVRMIRTEPGLVSIPLEKAVYCGGCRINLSAVRSLRVWEDRPNCLIDLRAMGPRSRSGARIGRIAVRLLRASI